MNWVAPIKDDETLERFKNQLRKLDDKYYILFEIGVGTGLQLQEILQLKIGDVKNKEYLEVYIGSKKIRRVFLIPEELQRIIAAYTNEKPENDFLIVGHEGSSSAISREQAYRALKLAGKQIGLTSIGAQTMRKTFAWRYYKETGDIYYLQNLLNHASPSVTYRYIGEKPNVEVVMKKLTPEENERSRFLLYQDGNGKKRIEEICRFMNELEKEMDNPSNNDAFYGKVDCFLKEAEDLISYYKKIR